MGKSTEKPMGFWSATAIGMGAMIGAGIFALVGVAVSIAGQLAYASFLVAGAIALLTTYSVSKLATTFPSKGGRVEYLLRGFGKGVTSGTLNLVMWLGYIIVTSLYAKAFAQYAAAMAGIEEGSALLPVLSTGVVSLFVVINFLGAGLVGKAEIFVVAVKVLILVLFAILGLTTMTSSQLAVSAEYGLNDLMLAGGVVFMSYEGFGLVANTAEDMENPRKVLPRALFTSVIAVMVVYVLVCLATTGNLSTNEIIGAKEYALAKAAKPVMGSLGFMVMGIAALFSTASAINATIYGPVHMLQETAKAGQAPKLLVRNFFGHDSGIALLLTGAMVAMIAAMLDLEAIAETGSLIFMIIYGAVNVANFRLRDKTRSNPVIIVASMAGIALSFCSLFYFELIKNGISVYVFLSLFTASYIFELTYQRVSGNERF